jgi:hypothetical protein
MRRLFGLILFGVSSIVPLGSFADQRSDLINGETQEIQRALDAFMLNKPPDANDFVFEIERSKQIVAGLEGTWALVLLGSKLGVELGLGLGCHHPRTNIHVLNDYEFTINLPASAPSEHVDVRYTVDVGNQFHTYADFSVVLKADGKDMPPNPQPGDVFSATRFMRTAQLFRPSPNVLIIYPQAASVLPMVFARCQKGI